MHCPFNQLWEHPCVTQSVPDLHSLDPAALQHAQIPLTQVGLYMFKGSRIGANGVSANDPCLHSRGQNKNSWLSNSITWTPYTPFFIPFWSYIANDCPHQERTRLFSFRLSQKLFYSFSLLHSSSWEFNLPKVSRIRPQLISFQELSRQEKLAFCQKNDTHRFLKKIRPTVQSFLIS